jgi:hypothetical protein
VPPTNRRVRPQGKSIHTKENIVPNIDESMSTGSDDLPQVKENLNSALPAIGPHSIIQHIVGQTTGISDSTRRSLSEEENAVHNMHRNNDDDEFDGINVPNTGKPPPRPGAVPTSGPSPTITGRTSEGNSTKHDNSVRKSGTGKTNISSYNMRRNKVKNSFNDRSKQLEVGSSDPPGELES